MCTVYMPRVSGGQEWMSNSPELELGMVMGSQQEQVLLNSEPWLQHQRVVSTVTLTRSRIPWEKGLWECQWGLF